MQGTTTEWATAIAVRITDELACLSDLEDASTLKLTLERLFKENPWAIRNLIGTGIIEEDYFDHLD